jgi:hypothetical protein
MYRAFAPFFEGVRGDRRVTGFLLKEIRIMGIIGLRERYRRQNYSHYSYFFQKSFMGISFNSRHGMGGMAMRREAGGHLAGEFSRESGDLEALMHPHVCLRH